MADNEKGELEAAFEVFCKAWGVDSNKLLMMDKPPMIQAYYLDALIGTLNKMMKPAPIIIAKPKGLG